MIQKIDFIPDAKSSTIRDQIRRDIQEALNNRIEMFEFVGYKDYKNLVQNAKEVVNRAKRNMINDLIRCQKLNDVEESYKKRNELRNHYPFIVSKRTMEDRVHVFMKIDYAEFEYLGGKVRW